MEMHHFLLFQMTAENLVKICDENEDKIKFYL